ncbi:MAG: DNA polymerase [Pseudomonadota bacterium]
MTIARTTARVTGPTTVYLCIEMSLRWFFLDLNSYFASVEQAERPELQGRPVAVVPMMADTTCCLAASYPAKSRGVKTGTSIRDAKRLCPGIVFVQADHRRYVRYHKRIVETVDKHLPVQKILSIDEMACELIGRECDEEFIRQKAQQIKAAIANEISPALTCSIGVAPNRYLAKVASDMQKPDGLTILHQHEIIERLSNLEPRDFPGVGPRMEERFHAERCYTAGQMFALTIPEMISLWGGVVGERFFYLIRGQNLPEIETKRGSISHSKVLPPDARSLEAAWPVAVRLLTKACIRLRSEGFYTKELWLSLKYTDRDPAHRSWQAKSKCFETQDSLLLIEELERLWGGAPRRAILRVGIALSGLVEATHHQLHLFEDKRRESLMDALDSINNRFKDGAVYVADAHSALSTKTNAIAFQRIPGEDE